ncbi:helix-turn-helix transcriptional regulator [Gulosibacter sp. 10]|uniref:ArsR/SmtB family transcription factor n=1 Tax=Gulosibacter sp. 10 TaxID=1255570 RepID=UPI00097F371F|nr:winged helix-turn-helix domain-containing protein [Gulosibacter sp. 10]SJM68847.1 Transcriptional regulator, ArsR family [Gulosibacter sp. 10]
MEAQPDLAAAAALFADRTRARMLIELVDGAARPAGHLARIAGVAASTASSHLARLEAAGFVAVEVSGRTRRYRIADPRVVAAIEALLPLASTEPPVGLTAVESWRRLRVARSCYDHLAGSLGVDLLAGLLERGALVRTDGIDGTAPAPTDALSARVRNAPYAPGPGAEAVLGRIGVDLDALLGARRPLIRVCMDWSEQRHHLAGALGAAIMTRMLDLGWVARRSGRRDLRVLELESIAAWLAEPPRPGGAPCGER